MPQFRFNLDPVLLQRRTLEEQCQRELARALRERMILMDQLRQMQETISQSKRQLGDSLLGTVDLSQTSRFARYSGEVTQRARAFVNKLAIVEKQVDRARGALNESIKARKVLERLRERRYQQWVREVDRREAAMEDEFNTQRYARRMRLGMTG